MAYRNYQNSFNQERWTLEEFRDWQDMCLMCGGCTGHGPMDPHNNVELAPYEWSGPDRRCPSIEYYKLKAFGGQGRLLNAAAVWRDGEEITDDFINIMYTCSGCGVCNENCPLYQPMQVTLAAREEINVQGKPQPEPLPGLYKNIDEKHNLFGLEGRAKHVPDLPKTGKDLYFTGCYTSYLLPRIGYVNAELLKKGGLDVCHMGQEEMCCGEVARQGGNIELFRKIAKENVEKVKAMRVERVICSCAHCYKTWAKEYPWVLQEELPFKVVHVMDVLKELIDEGKLKPEIEINKTMTYHDPCFLRGINAYATTPEDIVSNKHEVARDVLAAIPGLELKEMERHGRWSYCCGAGAKISLNCYPDFAAATGAERITEAKEAADEVITACPVCYNQLRYAANAENVDIEVEDISILLAKSCGIDTEYNEVKGGDK